MLAISLAGDLNICESSLGALNRPLPEVPDDGRPSKESLDLEHVPDLCTERHGGMFGKYSSRWRDHLEEVAATEHHMYLVPGSKPISQVPYQAGPGTREIEEKMSTVCPGKI